jgi:hypothetical protein
MKQRINETINNQREQIMQLNKVSFDHDTKNQEALH